MPFSLDGVKYFSVKEIQEALGISRVTLWRWRQDGKIPKGHLHRGKNVVFAEVEVEAIREFAVGVKPISPDAEPSQLRLFEPRI